MLWFPVGVDLVYTPCLNLRRVRARGRRAGASGGLARCVSSLSGLCNLHLRPACAGGGGCGERPEKGCPRPEDSRCGSRAGLADIQLGPGQENLPAGHGRGLSLRAAELGLVCDAVTGYCCGQIACSL